jgi:two-component system alkaline phosphatase synthesis response regulator PhoP
MSRVLIIEDNADLAFGVVTALEAEGFDTVVAETGPDGVAQAGVVNADVIILDLMLPGFDGYRVLRTLRSAGVETPILILTARGEEADKVRGFRMGADDYVTKPFGASELVARVDALLRRPRLGNGRAVSSPTDTFGDVRINRAARTVKRGDALVSLTPKEYALLLALIDRGGAVASRNELLAEVWGYQTDVSTRTVDIHVSELRKKLEVNAAEPKHILTIRKTGYRFEP